MPCIHVRKRSLTPQIIAFNESSSKIIKSSSLKRDVGCKEERPTVYSDDDMSGQRKPSRTVAVACVLAAMVLVVLDAAIANIALPTIARSLHVTPAMSVWVITAYQTGLLMFLLPSGALGEKLGYRRVFAVGVVLFSGASVLCALSPSLPWLVAARFLQGVGGAAVMALGIALLRLVVPRQRLGAAIGWNATAVALSSAAGPAIGAVVLSFADWPWLFAVNFPLGVLVLLATRELPHSGKMARRLDFFSMALNAAAFGSLIVGAELLLSKPQLASVLLAVAAFGFVVLVRREMPKKTPLIPLDLLRAGSFRISVIASVFCFAGQTAGVVALPFYLQHGLGQNALMTGLYMMPWPLTVAMAARFIGRLADRVPSAYLCAAGGMCLSTGLGSVALWPLKEDLLPLIPLTMLCGLGFSLFNVANNRSMFLSAPHERSGAVGGMQGTARLFGQTVGAVAMTLLFTLTSADTAPQIGLGIGAVLTLMAGLVSTLRSSSVEHNALR